MRAQFLLMVLCVVPYLCEQYYADTHEEDKPRSYYVLMDKKKRWVTPGIMGRPGIDMDKNEFYEAYEMDKIIVLPSDNYKPKKYSKWEKDAYLEECYRPQRVDIEQTLMEHFGHPPEVKADYSCEAIKDIHQWLIDIANFEITIIE